MDLFGDWLLMMVTTILSKKAPIPLRLQLLVKFILIIQIIISETSLLVDAVDNILLVKLCIV